MKISSIAFNNLIPPLIMEELDEIVVYKEITLADLTQNYILFPFAILIGVGVLLFIFAIISYIRDKRRDW